MGQRRYQAGICAYRWLTLIPNRIRRGHRHENSLRVSIAPLLSKPPDGAFPDRDIAVAPIDQSPGNHSQGWLVAYDDYVSAVGRPARSAKYRFRSRIRREQRDRFYRQPQCGRGLLRADSRTCDDVPLAGSLR